MRTLLAFPMFALFGAVAACSAPADTLGELTENFSEGGQDSWGPSLRLRDTTDTFPGKPTGGWYVSPIHATLLPDGKVLVTGWSRSQLDQCQFPEGSRANGESFVLDPSELGRRNAPGEVAIQPIDEVVDRDFRLKPADAPNQWSREVLYCAGHTPTAGGVLYTGGSRYQYLGQQGREIEIGISSARMLDYTTGRFRKLAAPMLGGAANETVEGAPSFGPVSQRGWRWYPTNTRMPDGSVLVTGGFSSIKRPNLSVESFDPARGSFSVMVQHDDASVPGFRDLMAPGLKDYTHTFLLPRPVTVGGKTRSIAMMGWNGRILTMSTDAATPAGQRFAEPRNGARPGGAQGWDSTSALLPGGRILVMGGTNNPAVAQRADVYDPATDTWTRADSGIGRRNASSVLLPDGTALVVNGWDEDGNLAGDRRRPQVFSPRTGKFQTFAASPNDTFERGYHSFAMLLKDGSVLLGGGTTPVVDGKAVASIGCERTDVRIYRPSYLTKGPRPVIEAPEPIDLTIASGSETSLPFSGATLASGEEAGVVLMALGSTTHSFDQNQRFVPLAHRVDAGRVVFRAPEDANVAPPGDYILFLVSREGTPSVGKHVRLAPRAEPSGADIRRTVLFMYGQTSPGQDMFLRGGIDHRYAQATLGRTCTAPAGSVPSNYACAIPLVHRNLKNATTAPLKRGDARLDWYGAEPGQNGDAVGTPADWTTNTWPTSFGPQKTVQLDGFGVDPLNTYGQHYWMVDVDMDCAATAGGWFEVKSFVSNGPGWEADVTQEGAPYASGNHFARCGSVNVFRRGEPGAVIRPLP